MRKAITGLVLTSCVMACSTEDSLGQKPGAGGAGGLGVGPTDAGLDVDLSCENVCCECDYGVLPPEVQDKCCATPAPRDASTQDVVVSDAVFRDAIRCENVCCECDYGDLPPDIAEECCSVDASPAPDATSGVDATISCENVCCDCDYGDPPPPECCP